MKCDHPVSFLLTRLNIARDFFTLKNPVSNTWTGYKTENYLRKSNVSGESLYLSKLGLIKIVLLNKQIG